MMIGGFTILLFGCLFNYNHASPMMAATGDVNTDELSDDAEFLAISGLSGESPYSQLSYFEKEAHQNGRGEIFSMSAVDLDSENSNANDHVWSLLVGALNPSRIYSAPFSSSDKDELVAGAIAYIVEKSDINESGKLPYALADWNANVRGRDRLLSCYAAFRKLHLTQEVEIIAYMLQHEFSSARSQPPPSRKRKATSDEHAAAKASSDHTGRVLYSDSYPFAVSSISPLLRRSNRDEKIDHAWGTLMNLFDSEPLRPETEFINIRHMLLVSAWKYARNLVEARNPGGLGAFDGLLQQPLPQMDVIELYLCAFAQLFRVPQPWMEAAVVGNIASHLSD